MADRVAYEHSRPDEVAECVDGVSPGLQGVLWGFVGDYEPGNVTEDNPRGVDYPGEVSETNKMPVFWDRLSEEHRAELRALEAGEIGESYGDDPMGAWHGRNE